MIEYTFVCYNSIGKRLTPTTDSVVVPDGCDFTYFLKNIPATRNRYIKINDMCYGIVGDNRQLAMKFKILKKEIN